MSTLRQKFLIAGAVLTAFFWSACGGSSPAVQNGGSLTTVLSDPATCSAATGGPYSHVYVTVTDVQANVSANGNSGWVDLTPGLKSAPMQVDLLGQADTQCFLATLGDLKQLPAGNYQQIRVMLLANSSAASVSNNQCGSGAANCVVLSSNNSVQPLQLSSESQTGIKIPAAQIAGGKLTVANGQAADLDIDFNSCASIVVEGNSTYRLKPVLTAGQVGVNSSTINGTITDNLSQPISGKVVVALERADSEGIDRVVMQTVTDANGNFVFCPVPAGTYDLVADALSGANVAYAATVTLGVQPGDSLGTVQLSPEPLASGQQPATITGQITSTGSGPVAISVTLAALQQVTLNSTSVLVTVPLPAQSSALETLDTGANGCATGLDCASYSLVVPAANPNIGQFSTGGTTYSQNATAPVTYTVDGLATALGATTSDCSSPELKVTTTSTGTSLQVAPGQTVTAAAMSFSGCS